MNRSAIAKVLAAVGIALAAPSFVFNFLAHDNTLPKIEDMDRIDGAFSLMFMSGAALIVASLVTSNPQPLRGKVRILLGIEAVMVVLAGIWAVLQIVDPEIVRADVHPLVAICDACWPLHQVFMLVVGIAAVRTKAWPSPARFSLFGPVAGLLVLGLGAGLGLDLLAAIGIGTGWAVVGVGVLAANTRPNAEHAARNHTELAVAA